MIARGYLRPQTGLYGSGFDRGHLLPWSTGTTPAGERGYVPFVERLPQRPGLNRGRGAGWKNGAALGGALRFALHRDRRRTDRRSDASAASGFRSGFLNDSGAGRRYFPAIVFLIPNTERPAGDCFRYAISVDSLERVLGMDFYSALPDSVEMRVEAFDRSFWR
ncbi:MAG: hypothetical protein ACLUEV_05795 [Alistipes sp.]